MDSNNTPNSRGDMPKQDCLTDESKRNFLKESVVLALGVGGSVLSPVVNAGDDDPRKFRPPRTEPFKDLLPVRPPKSPTGLNPLPAERAVPGEAGRDPHQLWSANQPDNYYELVVKEATHQFHSDLPPSTIWGYDGSIPGPTIVGRYGSPSVVRVRNALPEGHVGFGSPEISTHLHNGHNAPDSDGFPLFYYSRTKSGRAGYSPGSFKDHHYPHLLAGNDPREALGTLWYHDHTEHFTAANVYKGLAGFYLMFDEIDSGNENDPNPNALRLPSGVGQYDIPLVFQDKTFDDQGELYFDQFDMEGVVGNKFMVNGKIQPRFEVERRKYRFRMLNGSAVTWYEFYIVHEGKDQEIFRIASDGNLLPRRLTEDRIALIPAERADIVIDFSKYPIGSKLYVVNRLQQLDGRGPTGIRLREGTPFLRFDVVSEPVKPDRSQVPEQLRPLPPMLPVKRKRRFKFDRELDQWTINESLENSDLNQAYFTVVQGVPEIWEFRGSGGWSHPIHFHLEEGRIIRRNGKTPPPHERGRKDVIPVFQEERVEVYVNFRSFTGPYVLHCHNNVHEDHAMMVRFDVVAPAPDSSTEQATRTSSTMPAPSTERFKRFKSTRPNQRELIRRRR